MPTTPGALAFLFPSGAEWVVIVVVGILLFGRRLPEVGRTLGRTIGQLRHGFHKLKAEIDLDGDVGAMRDSLRETKDSLAETIGAPRGLPNPKQMLTDLTDETLSTPGPVGDVEPWAPPKGDEASRE